MSDQTRDLALGAFRGIDAAKRRLWAATDEVARLRRQLIDAEQIAEAAVRDLADYQKLLTDAWELLRSDLLSPPVSPDTPTPTGQHTKDRP